MTTATFLSSKTHNTYELFSVDIGRAHDIPNACIQLAKTLAATPLFDGSGSVVKCKVIALSNWNDARICDIFNANSSKILGNQNSWHIHDFGDGDYQLFDSRGEWMGHGVSLYLYDHLQMCSYEDLEASYDKVFSAMVSGWEKADFKDHPDIMFAENPEEFCLFMKDKSLIEEDTLIRFIASKFSLNENVKCHDQWLTHPGFRYGKIYLWVRKTEMDSTVGKIGFKLDK